MDRRVKLEADRLEKPYSLTRSYREFSVEAGVHSRFTPPKDKGYKWPCPTFP
jgi:hypothetical protein